MSTSSLQVNPRTFFMTKYAANVLQTACFWGGRRISYLYQSDKKESYEKVASKALELSPPVLQSCAVGMPMERLPESHSDYLYRVYNATKDEQQQVGSAEAHSSISDLSMHERRFAIALGNSMIAVQNRFSRVPWGESIEDKFTSKFIESSWKAHYEGNQDEAWKSLNWGKIAKIALGVVKHFEEQGFHLSDGYHFHQAVKFFHKKMKEENGWEGLPDKDSYYNQVIDDEIAIPFGEPYWTNSCLTLHAASAAHELYREPNEITPSELGIQLAAN